MLLFILIPCISAENVTIDNSTSIKDCVDNVSDGDVIYLNSGTYFESGIEINKNITLEGIGNSDKVIINGENRDSIIRVNSPSTVIIRNITFINGNSPDYGGAIHGELGGKIYADSCNFINNHAAINGGAIDIAGKYHTNPKKFNHGFLNATNCNFINNSADHDGGAIATIYGDSYVYDSIFRYNYADRDGGAIRVGVISTTLTLNCVFEDNIAKEWGGAFYNWLSGLVVDNCTINNNSAGMRGGAIFNAGTLTSTHNVITNNSADIGGVIYIHEEVPQIKPTVKFNFNYVDGNTANIGSLVYARQINPTKSDFNDNNWGFLNISNWDNDFISNDYFPNPDRITFEVFKENITASGNDNVTENKKYIPSNTSNLIEETAHTNTEHFKYSNTQSGLNHRKSDISIKLNGKSSVGSVDSGDRKVSEIVKKELSREYETDLKYIILIPFIFAMFYGFYRYRKRN